MILYLGYDGAYVLSKRPLHKLWDKGGDNFYLAPRTGTCHTIEDGDGGALLFSGLRLKSFDVVRFEIRVPKKPKTKKTRRKK